MKKFFLVLFILLDLAVMAGAAFVIYAHVTGQNRSPALSALMPPRAAPLIPMAKPAVALSSGTMASGTPATSPAATGAPDGTVRKIFSYRNSRAHRVLIRAEFTGWKAEPMILDKKKNVWVYTQALSPGEYAYGFTVDDKFIHDPANPKTKRIGTITASVIVVKPSLPAAPH